MTAHYKVGKRRQMIMPNAAPPALSPEDERLRRHHISRKWRARKRKRLAARIRAPFTRIGTGFRSLAGQIRTFTGKTAGGLKKAVTATGRMFAASGRGAFGILKLVDRGVGAVVRGIDAGANAIRRAIWSVARKTVRGMLAGVKATGRFVRTVCLTVIGWIRAGILAVGRFCIALVRAVRSLVLATVRLVGKLIRAFWLVIVGIGRGVAAGAAWCWSMLKVGLARALSLVRGAARILATLARNFLDVARDPRMRSARAMAVYLLIGVTTAGYVWRGEMQGSWDEWQRERARDAARAEREVPVILADSEPQETEQPRQELAPQPIELAEIQPAAEDPLPQNLDGVIDEIVAEDEARQSEWAEAATVVEERESVLALDQPAEQEDTTQSLVGEQTAAVASESQSVDTLIVNGQPVELSGAKRIRLPEADPDPEPEPVTNPAPVKVAEASEPAPLTNVNAGKAALVTAPAATWVKYAAAVPNPESRLPKLVIVIDDLGLSRRASRDLETIQGPLTLAFLPYANGLPDQTARLRQAGHELMVHMPMQPQGRGNPGRNALLVDLERAEFMRRLDWNLNRFEGFVGINNHMGSALTENHRAMEMVMAELKMRGLLFLDSLTTSDSKAYSSAEAWGVPVMKRDIFLDNDRDEALIRKQLYKAERVARRLGHAIAIGHPYPETLRVLEDWTPKASSRGVQLISLGALMQMQQAERERKLAEASSASDAATETGTDLASRD